MSRAKVVRINAVFFIPYEDNIDDTLRALTEQGKLKQEIEANKAVVVERWNAMQTTVAVK